MKERITCRPCKEEGNWEIEDQNGNVLKKHYATKQTCVRAGERLANECACELVVEDLPKSSK